MFNISEWKKQDDRRYMYGNVYEDFSVGRQVVSIPEGEFVSPYEPFDNFAIDCEKTTSDGSTATYYELPEGATELQDLISYKNLNAQMGEIFRACYRYGQVKHSPKMRDAQKIAYYIAQEIARLEKYGDG